MFRAEVSAAPEGARVQWVTNGQVVGEVEIQGARLQTEYRAHAQAAASRWHRLDVRDGAGQLLLLTNPFFSGPAPAPMLHTFGDFARRAGT